MGASESETLCAHLTGSVGNRPATEFYQEFTLDKGLVFAEFFFKEMMQIYHYPGMEEWPEVLSMDKSGTPGPPMYMSLVCFQRPKTKESKQAQQPQCPLEQRAQLAHDMACEMLCSCFNSKEDHKSVKVAMANYPTIAIFLSQHDPRKKKRGKFPGQAVRKSIFDVKDHTSLHCLAAVNYTRPLQGNDTVVLWLATTLKAPPIESTHVTWWNLGLASYLLCMLVKQHTVNDWDWKYCALYLQASRQRDNPARRFYLKMGFQCHDHKDNGYEKLPYQFRLQVHNHPRIWIDEKKEAMSLCVLRKGQLSLPQRIEEIGKSRGTPELIVSPGSCSSPSWKNYFYARFPWPCNSMKKLEGHFDSRPFLEGLSWDPLPLTDRPLPIYWSMSSVSGQIDGERRTKMNATSWLKTDEIQFLFGLLLRNQHDHKGLLHVLGPMITHKVSLVFKVMEAITSDSATTE